MADNIIYGTERDDKITGSKGRDIVYAGAGNDNVKAGAGNDKIYGGKGNDTLDGGAGNDELFGEDGDDTLLGGAGDDFLDGGAGNDELRGGDGNDRMVGGTGNDSFYGGLGIDTAVLNESTSLYTFKLSGARGDVIAIAKDGSTKFISRDVENVEFADGLTFTRQNIIDSINSGKSLIPTNLDVRLTAKDDVVSGLGDDIVRTSGANLGEKDVIQMGSGYDTLIVDDVDGISAAKIGPLNKITGVEHFEFQVNAAHNVTLADANFEGVDGPIKLTFNSVGDSATIMRMVDASALTAGHDVQVVFTGGDSSAVVKTGAGNDYISTNAWEKTVYAGAGDDFVMGSSGRWGADKIYGEAGNDKLYGGTDNDMLDGGEGDDLLDGGQGDDKLIGGTGNDTIIGGDGVDTAVWLDKITAYTFRYASGVMDSNSQIIVEGLDGVDIIHQDVENFAFLDRTLTLKEIKDIIAKGGRFDENKPPVLKDDAFTAQKNNAVTLNVLANDSDPEGDALTVTGVSAAAHGNVVINSNGTLTYTPNAGYTGADTFTYTVKDTAGNSSQATVTLNVVNNAPTNLQDIESAANTIKTDAQNGDVVHITANATDANGDAITYALSNNADGRFAINANSGVVTVANAALLAAGTYTITVDAFDTDGAKISKDFSITVEGAAITPLDVRLTSVTDTVIGTSGDDIVRTSGIDWSALDTVQLGGGKDTLIVDTGTANALNLANVNGVEVFNFDTAAAHKIVLKDSNFANVTDSTITLNFVGGSAGTVRNIDASTLSAGHNVIVNFAAGDSGGIIKTGAGDDTIKAGDWLKKIYAGDGDDTIIGGSGRWSNVEAYGEDGNDKLHGGAYNDILNGGDGNDLLNGGAGNDTLFGGAGEDTFQLGKNYGTDTIKDYSLADDTLKFYGTNAAKVDDLTITVVGNNTEISVADGSKFVLENFTDVDNLRAHGKFIFEQAAPPPPPPGGGDGGDGGQQPNHSREWLADHGITAQELNLLKNLPLFEAEDLQLMGWAKGTTQTHGDSRQAFIGRGFDAVEGAPFGTYAVNGHVYWQGPAIVQFNMNALARGPNDAIPVNQFVKAFEELGGYQGYGTELGDFEVTRTQNPDGTFTYDMLATRFVAYNAAHNDVNTFAYYQDVYGNRTLQDSVDNLGTRQIGGNLTSLEYSPEVMNILGFDMIGNTAMASIVSSTGIVTGTTYAFNKSDAMDGDGMVDTRALSIYSHNHPYLGWQNHYDHVVVDNINSYWKTETPDVNTSETAFAFSIGGSLVYIRTVDSPIENGFTEGYGDGGLGINAPTYVGGKGDKAIIQSYYRDTGELANPDAPLDKSNLPTDPNIVIDYSRKIEILMYSWAELLDPTVTDPKPYLVTRHVLQNQSFDNVLMGLSLSQDDNGNYVLAMEMGDVYKEGVEYSPQYLFYRLNLDSDHSGNVYTHADGTEGLIDANRTWEDAFPMMQNLGEVSVLGTNLSYLDVLNGADIYATV